MSTFNVLRYSALGAGLVYGAVHRYNLGKAEENKKVAEAWKSEEKLIREAKREYKRLHPVKEVKGSINWEDENLDWGKALESLVEKL